MTRFKLSSFLLIVAAVSTSGGRAGPATTSDGIIEIDPANLSCHLLVTFDDFTCPPSPGVAYDTVLTSNGATFGERFAGQNLSYDGDFDVLSGTPTGPLSLIAGAPSQNLCVYYDTPFFNTCLMTGVGPVGHPYNNGIGEGAFAVLLPFDQVEFGFELLGGGNAVVNFFRRDGSLIDTITLTNYSGLSYGFRRSTGTRDIAGFSVHNSDPGGLAFDNLCFDGDTPTATSFATWGSVKGLFSQR
jgi:hypothetical protein